MRSSGLYAVLAGEILHVKMHDSDHVQVEGPLGRLVRHEMDELDDLLSVRTATSSWPPELSIRQIPDPRGRSVAAPVWNSGIPPDV